MGSNKQRLRLQHHDGVTTTKPGLVFQHRDGVTQAFFYYGSGAPITDAQLLFFAFLSCTVLVLTITLYIY